MFYCLSASLLLDFEFKWFSTFNLDQTFSLNILTYEQMFDRLATSALSSASKACSSVEKPAIGNGLWVTPTYFFQR